MVTFYQCLQEYLGKPGAVAFSKKEIKRISNYCRVLYDDLKVKPPVKYVQSREGEEVFEVRAYPEFFKLKIMKVLESSGKHATEDRPGEVEVIKVEKKRERKRIVVNRTPEYSARPK